MFPITLYFVLFTQRKKTLSTACDAYLYLLLWQTTLHQSYFILKPVKIFVPTSRQRLLWNIKLTVTIRVWRLHLHIHVLFPLSLSHTLLFLVKKRHSSCNSFLYRLLTTDALANMDKPKISLTEWVSLCGGREGDATGLDEQPRHVQASPLNFRETPDMLKDKE